ncbi:MAG TPA: helix-turn-helix domain-containing protein [Micromonosporaceae bacterium]|nr:helix-turn-helix domain-containing protein [Micromonosporaceae bacterium]
MDEPTSDFVRRRPAAPLRPFVASYQGYRQAGGPPGRHRGLPSPHLTVIITLDDPLVIAAHPDPATPPGRYDALVGGLHTAPALITHDGRQSGIQIDLSPLGARALLGLPAGEIAGADLDAAAVWGPFAAELRERVLAATGWARRFAVLDELLMRRLDPDAQVQPEVSLAWRWLLLTSGGVAVSALAREVGWSRGHLSQRFGIEVGLRPKAAARVMRFDRARWLLQGHVSAGRTMSLATLAATCGYFDQAHLAREFGEFAGCSPSGWLAEEFANIQAFAVPALPGSTP